MSHTLVVSAVNNNPAIPLQFDGNSGSAVPVAHILNVLGSSVAAGTSPVQTIASGNTVTTQVQISQAIAAADATKIGLSNFSSADFAVDADGFVTLSTIGAAKTITGNTGGALSPTDNNWNILGAGSLTTVGSGSTLTAQLTGLTQYSVLVGAGNSTITKIGPSATAGQIFQSAGASANPAFSTATYPSTTTINTIMYSSAADTVSQLATTARASLTTDSAGAPTWRALTNGQIIIGSTAGSPAAATLTADSGIAITNGSNSIAIAVTGGGLAWNNVTGASQTVFSRNGYIANRGTLITFTMNSTNFGDVARIVGTGAGGWTLLPSGTQRFQLGNALTTVTTGSLSSTNAGDCVELVALSSTLILVMSSIGNITVV